MNRKENFQFHAVILLKVKEGKEQKMIIKQLYTNKKSIHFSHGSHNVVLVSDLSPKKT